LAPLLLEAPLVVDKGLLQGGGSVPGTGEVGPAGDRLAKSVGLGEEQRKRRWLHIKDTREATQFQTLSGNLPLVPLDLRLETGQVLVKSRGAVGGCGKLCLHGVDPAGGSGSHWLHDPDRSEGGQHDERQQEQAD